MFFFLSFPSFFFVLFLLLLFLFLFSLLKYFSLNSQASQLTATDDEYNENLMLHDTVTIVGAKIALKNKKKGKLSQQVFYSLL